MPWFIETARVPTQHEHLLEEIVDGATTPEDAEDIAILYMLSEPSSVLTLDVFHDSQQEYYTLNVMEGIPNAFKVRHVDKPNNIKILVFPRIVRFAETFTRSLVYECWIDLFVPGKLFKRFIEESRLSLINGCFRE